MTLNSLFCADVPLSNYSLTRAPRHVRIISACLPKPIPTFFFRNSCSKFLLSMLTLLSFIFFTLLLLTHSQTAHCSPVSDVSAWQHLRSANQRLLVVPQCLLSTLGRRAFSLADTSLCNSSRQLVRSGSSQGQFQTSAEVAFCYTLL